MGRKNGPRHGSMQFWPRKRSDKFLPRVNWNPILENSSRVSNSVQKSNILGFISYKAGMASAYVKDNTPDSMTKGKRIVIPVTILECPSMKIFSVRFYKNGVVKKEIINENLNKELKKVVKFPSKKINIKEELDKIKIEEFEDLQVLVYSEVKKSELKKTPDITELALSGNKQDKLEFVKANISKELSVTEVLQKGLVDVRGLTKGKGFQGPVKRFGIDLRSHKAEKGQRKPGSIGPWHPIGVPFTVARPGGMGMFSRIAYNVPIVTCKKYNETEPISKMKFENYGNLKTDYIVLHGSVPGSFKRQVLLTSALRPTRKQLKKQFELVELR